MKKLQRNAMFTGGFIVAATLLAKMCGFLRDIVVASLYGTATAEAIAFSSASRVPLIFFDIALGSAVTSAFIPIFNEYLAKGQKERAIKFSNQFITLVVLVTGVMATIGMLFSSQFIGLIVGDLDSEKLSLASSLVRILFPTIIFTGLAYCFVGILQSYEQFYIPAIISLVSNGLLIIYLLIFKDKFGITGVAIAMLIAWLGQCLVQIPSLRKIGHKFSPGLNFKDEGIKKVCLLALPIVISTWVQPINTMINMRLASGLDGGAAVTALDYANKLYIILVGVFTFSVTNLIFPSMSRFVANGDTEKFSAIITKAVKYVVLIIMPVMIGFLLLGKPIIRLFYERGAFDQNSTFLTSTALFNYSLGMLGFGIQEISNKGFYALHDGKTPMRTAMMGIGVNILLSIFFVLGLKVGLGGLALAASVAANITGFTLLFLLNKKAGGIVDKSLGKYFAKVLLSAAVMGVGVYFAYTFTMGITENKVLVLFCPVVIGAAIYLMLCTVFKISEFTDIIHLVKNKLKGGSKA